MNKVAVITGSSSGIGKAIALRLARAGFDIVVHAGSSRQLAQQVAQSVVEQGRQAIVEVCDFSDSSALDDFVDKCWNWQDNVTAWINNAGADVLTGAAAELGFTEKLQQVLQVDVVASLVLSRAIGKRMAQAYKAVPTDHSIINIGWDQANHGMAGDSGEMFAASKGAIMACSKSLAQSLAPAVRVNCIAPGWIQTSWGQQASPEWQARAKGESLLNRWGTPEDIAGVAEFLVSQAGQFVNGQVINVNGGFRFPGTTGA